MSGSVFIGRQMELFRLGALQKKKTPALAVVKGRRRIGKSRLVFELAKKTGQTFWSFAGLAPQEGINDQEQRNNFARQLSFMLKIPPMTFQDWSDAFEHLSLHLKPGCIVLFDEISWMGSKDATFIPKLKAWYDKQTINFLLVFCGSVSTWIEENILKSTAFFGRINLTINLEPFSITESFEFLKEMGINCSNYDSYKLLSTLGGVPWYLEQLNPKISADENIGQLAFTKNGLLVTEFDRIFHDLFDSRGSTYKKILSVISQGPKTLSEIRKTINFSHSGTLSQMMDNLFTAGFVDKQPLWAFKTASPSKQSLYRISDPYMRFYLKFIEPSMSNIIVGDFEQIPLSALTGFDSHMGLQIETLLLQNRSLLVKKLGISPIDVLHSGPYRQTKTSIQSGCQIDYLIQTKTNNLFVCEFKFKRRELDKEIISQMQEKISRLKTPKGFSKIPVLFHLGGVTDSVESSTFFYRIVDIADFLESN